MDKKTQMNFNLNNFALALSPLLDGVETQRLTTSPHHSKRIAFVSLKLGIMLKLDAPSLADLCAYSLSHHLALNVTENEKECCKLSSDICSSFPFLQPCEDVLKYQQEYYNGTGLFGLKAKEIPLLSQLISFAHTLDTRFDFSKPSIENRVAIVEFVKQNSNKLFMQTLCDTFLDLATQPSFWLDMQSENEMLQFIYVSLNDFTTIVSFEKMLAICSHFTSLVDVHSKIIEKAALMCEYYQFEHKDKQTFLIAVSLENIGKLMIPKEILHKKSDLNPNEFEEVKAYPYYTKKALSAIMGFSDIATLASTAHEYLDGSGYPYFIQANALSLKNRLMAALVIYEALRAKKSYHEAFSHKEAIEIMSVFAQNYKIDAAIVEDMNKVFETI